MADTKTIKNKLKSVGNIKKITKAMEMVARSKMKRSIDRALAVRPFAFFGLEFLVNFAYLLENKNEKENNAEEKEKQNIFYKAPELTAARTLIIEITANKGLCGGYNGNMFRELRRFVAEKHIVGTETDYIAVGKYAMHHAQLLHGTLLTSFTNFSEQVSLSEVEQLANFVKQEYTTGKYKVVYVAFTNFVSTLIQKPTVFQLLPLSAEVFKNQLAEAGGEENRINMKNTEKNMLGKDWSAYKIEPSREAVLDLIIPKLVTVQIYQAVLEALASEQAARMIAMKNATENADSLSESLTLSYNHLRQEGITRELSEIAAGAEVMHA